MRTLVADVGVGTGASTRRRALDGGNGSVIQLTSPRFESASSRARMRAERRERERNGVAVYASSRWRSVIDLVRHDVARRTTSTSRRGHLRGALHRVRDARKSRESHETARVVTRGDFGYL